MITRAVSAATRSKETTAADDLLRLSSNSQTRAAQDFVRVTRARRAALRDRVLAIEPATEGEREEEKNDDVGLLIPKRGRPPKHWGSIFFEGELQFLFFFRG